jgi:hypothetical protein
MMIYTVVRPVRLRLISCAELGGWRSFFASSALLLLTGNAMATHSIYEAGKYHDYEEVGAMLHKYAEAYPEFATIESVGATLDDKQLWLLTITDSSTGTHDSKPAFWCDGNTHAGEVTGTQCCLHLIHTIFSKLDEKDPVMTDMIASSTVYVLPRISADGAEYMLTTPYSCRSSPVLLDPLETPGFVADDLDGDGACVLMRKPDPAGTTKTSSEDPRIMVSRAPHERGDPDATYYRLWPEGQYRDYDGATQKSAPGYGLDLNRMSPYQYAPEGVQSGAGPLPGFLPQGQAVYEALVARNNVTTLQSYHTSGRMILHSSPTVTGSDSGVFDSLAKLGEKLTGYHQVTGNYYLGPVDFHRGGECPWAYEHRGIVSFSNECWNLMEHALSETTGEMYDHGNDLGMGGGPKMDAVGSREEDYVNLYKYLDANFPGRYIKEWTPYDHPQLGTYSMLERSLQHGRRSGERPIVCTFSSRRVSRCVCARACVRARFNCRPGGNRRRDLEVVSTEPTS